jgi:LPS-assembly protein
MPASLAKNKIMQYQDLSTLQPIIKQHKGFGTLIDQALIMIKCCIALLFKCIAIKLIILLLNNNAAFASIKQDNQPAFVKADFIEYDSQKDLIYAKGNVQVKLDEYLLKADSLLYEIDKDLLWAEGEVTVKDDKGRIIFGNRIVFKDKLKSCIISDFIMKFNGNNLLASRLAKRLTTNQILLYHSRFTPCSISCNRKPIWQMSAQKTQIDFQNERMVYKNLFFEVYGIPIFYTPYFSHPTPSAKAKSGILVPSIKKNYLTIPFYIRAKPNMDFTISPRLFKNYTLMEIEARHRLAKGDYTIDASSGRVPYRIKDNKGAVIKDSIVSSYHIFTKGNFHHEDYQYGFNLKRTSDKAYLKNYHNLHDGYLESKLYLHKVDYGDYFSARAFHFQGLRAGDSKKLDPLILPQIRTKNIFSLNDDFNSFFTVRNDILSYKERDGSKIDRGSTKLSLTRNMISKNGHIINLAFYNSADIYSVNQISSNNINNLGNKKNKVLTRYIPDLQTSWRYPLVRAIKSSSSIIIEPIVTAIIGRKFKPSYNKYGFIDSNQYEISEDNLFSVNKYSGIDYHEFGNRLSYGINSGLLSNDNYFSLFVGQSLHKYNNSTLSNNAENVGKASLNFSGTFELFYRYRRSKNFSPIRDELGINFQNDMVQFTSAFTKLENLRKYYANDGANISNNRAEQVYYDIDYKLTSNWSLGNEMRLELSKKKMQMLSKTIKVTYLKDCVRISAKLADDYTSDNTRGIRKSSSSFTISIGLKVLNM